MDDRVRSGLLRRLSRGADLLRSTPLLLEVSLVPLLRRCCGSASPPASPGSLEPLRLGLRRRRCSLSGALPDMERPDSSNCRDRFKTPESSPTDSFRLLLDSSVKPGSLLLSCEDRSLRRVLSPRGLRDRGVLLLLSWLSLLVFSPALGRRLLRSLDFSAGLSLSSTAIAPFPSSGGDGTVSLMVSSWR